MLWDGLIWSKSNKEIGCCWDAVGGGGGGAGAGISGVGVKLSNGMIFVWLWLLSALFDCISEGICFVAEVGRGGRGGGGAGGSGGCMLGRDIAGGGGGGGGGGCCGSGGYISDADCWLNMSGCGMLLFAKFPPGDCWL